MSTYAIGDLQGSFASLQKLLRRIAFDAGSDRLWFVGDLVNRGPESLECLRFVRGLGNRAVAVLGNHDLHLISVAQGTTALRKSDTLQSVLDAPDCGELIEWLRTRPLLHREAGFVMVHAGLLPQWDADQAARLANEVEEALRGPRHHEFFAQMYGNAPDVWSDALHGYDRLRVIVNALTRLRACDAEGRMEFSYKGEPRDFPQGYMPWFDVPGRRSAGSTIVCGHWSALGLRTTPNLLAIDSGCLWGRQLTAIRLEDRTIHQVSCAGITAAEFD